MAPHRNLYIVKARFERGKTQRRVEFWKGEGRNLATAMRKAVGMIMKRSNVHRFRHERVTWSIDKVDTAIQKKAVK